jgi:hypothetical protein
MYTAGSATFIVRDNRIMPVVDKATHIGITRSDTNSARTTVDENIRKARRVTYSLMGTGLHGENGLYFQFSHLIQSHQGNSGEG